MNMELINLIQDFISTCKIYGRIIISERFIDTSRKTIRPSIMGGVAGGEKYIVNNGFFFFLVFFFFFFLFLSFLSFLSFLFKKIDIFSISSLPLPLLPLPSLSSPSLKSPFFSFSSFQICSGYK